MVGCLIKAISKPPLCNGYYQASMVQLAYISKPPLCNGYYQASIVAN